MQRGSGAQGRGGGQGTIGKVQERLVVLLRAHGLLYPRLRLLRVQVRRVYA